MRVVRSDGELTSYWYIKPMDTGLRPWSATGMDM